MPYWNFVLRVRWIFLGVTSKKSTNTAYQSLFALENAKNDQNQTTDSGDEEADQSLIIFREALSAVESSRRRQLVQPNWDTYAGLLYAADRLLSSKKHLQLKQQTIERVFGLSCSDGMVEESVLKALMAVATSEGF